MNKKRYLSMCIPILLILLITTIIASCSPQQATPTPGQTATPTPGQTTTPTTPAPGGVKMLKIGLLGSWTGTYAPGGVPHRQSTLNAVKLINEAGGFNVAGQQYKIDLIEYDDRTDTKRAAAGITWMIDQHDIKMTIGPFSSPSTLAAQPIAETRRVLTQTWAVADDATRESIKYSWSWATAGSVWSIYTVAFWKDVLKLKTIALITENEAYCLSVRTGCVSQLQAKGITTVSDQQFDSGTMEFSTVIARARQANPDALFLDVKMGSSILLVRQIAEAGWKVQLLANPDTATSDNFRVNGPSLEGMFGGVNPGYWAFKNNQFPQAALDAMGTNMAEYMRISDSYIADYTNAIMDRVMVGYTGLNAYIKLMQKVGTTNDTVALRNAFEGFEWDDPPQHQRALANHRFKFITSMAIYHASDKADKFDIVSILTHTDDAQQIWKSQEIMKVPTIDEIRKTRGY